MKVINLPDRINHAEQVSDVEKYIGDSKAKLSLILSEPSGRFPAFGNGHCRIC